MNLNLTLESHHNTMGGKFRLGRILPGRGNLTKAITWSAVSSQDALSMKEVLVELSQTSRGKHLGRSSGSWVKVCIASRLITTPSFVLEYYRQNNRHSPICRRRRFGRCPTADIMYRSRDGRCRTGSDSESVDCCVSVVLSLVRFFLDAHVQIANPPLLLLLTSSTTARHGLPSHLSSRTHTFPPRLGLIPLTPPPAFPFITKESFD